MTSRRQLLKTAAAFGLLGSMPALAAIEEAAKMARSADDLPALKGPLTVYLGRGEGGLYDDIVEAIVQGFAGGRHSLEQASDDLEVLGRIQGQAPIAVMPRFSRITGHANLVGVIDDIGRQVLRTVGVESPRMDHPQQRGVEDLDLGAARQAFGVRILGIHLQVMTHGEVKLFGIDEYIVPGYAKDQIDLMPFERAKLAALKGLYLAHARACEPAWREERGRVCSMVVRTALDTSSAFAPGLWMICIASAGLPSSRLRRGRGRQVSFVPGELPPQLLQSSV